MVSTPPQRLTSTSLTGTPGSWQRITRSEPRARMPVVGLQASGCPRSCVPGPESAPLIRSDIRCLSLTMSDTPRNGL